MKKPILAQKVTANKGASLYPRAFKKQVAGRTKHKLGDFFGLKNFGVNLTELEPKSISSLAHYHAKQDEFIYILEGEATLKLGDKTYILHTGDCMGFQHGEGIAHQLINHSGSIVRYLEVGDRSKGDSVVYPKDDIAACFNAETGWQFSHKDATPY